MIKGAIKGREDDGLIRPPAGSVPGLNNRDCLISSPGEIGVETQTTLPSPFWERVARGNWVDAKFCL